MVCFDRTLMCIHDRLDAKEAEAFCLFLLAERYRHAVDIRLINRTLSELARKHGLDLDRLERKLSTLVLEDEEDFRPGGTI